MIPGGREGEEGVSIEERKPKENVLGGIVVTFSKGEFSDSTDARHVLQAYSRQRGPTQTTWTFAGGQNLGSPKV